MSDLTRRRFLQCAMAAGAAASFGSTPAFGQGGGQRPNIVFIYADDMGWGDPQCYNPDSAIPTPNMDRLAREGMRFTDAHTPGAVCTPSRYGLLTGRYYWRMELERMGLNGYSANIMDTQRTTVASVLRGRGYRTACVGKWHLGMGTEEPADFSTPKYPNPTSFGFDYYFGIPASLDYAPYVFMDNEMAIQAPTEEIEGTPRKTPEFYRGGPIAPDFKHVDVLPKFTDKAVDIIDTHGASGGDDPLFLYFAMNAPHTPWMPVAEAKGKSEAGKYGDFVWQVDDSIGAVMAALERNGMSENTLLIVSSDNGGLTSWLPEGIDHECNGPWRGEKADAWEGGHRVPFIAKWPGKIEAGTTNSALICMTDMMATFADITGAPLPDYDALNDLTIGEDSESFAACLLEGNQTARDGFIAQSSAGLFAVREGDWKLITGLGGGGLGYNPRNFQPEPGGPEGQLYNLKDDPAETTNLWLEMPEKVKELQAVLDRERG